MIMSEKFNPRSIFGSNPLAGIEVFGIAGSGIDWQRYSGVVIPWRGLRSLGCGAGRGDPGRADLVVIPWRGLRSLGYCLRRLRGGTWYR